jgi:periplasmic copper chaperone A
VRDLSKRPRVTLLAMGVSMLAAGLVACARPSLEEGRALYETNGCASCHGLSGHGDGPVARGLSPAPLDFREDGAFRNGATTSGIANTLLMGFSRGGPGMPAFRNLQPVERESLALYVISLREEAGDGAAAITAKDAWARPTLPNRTETAAYLTLENPTLIDHALVGVSSPMAGTVELHEMTVDEHDIMSMGPVGQIVIPANGNATLAPGGLHLMIFGLTQALRAGDTLTLDLKLDDGRTITVDAAVRNQ